MFRNIRLLATLWVNFVVWQLNYDRSYLTVTGHASDEQRPKLCQKFYMSILFNLNTEMILIILNTLLK